MGDLGLEAPPLLPDRMVTIISIFIVPSGSCVAVYSLTSFSVLVPHFLVPPEELYATQLSQLQEMGFFDTRENIQALMATAGNVHAAVERLLGNPGQ